MIDQFSYDMKLHTLEYLIALIKVRGNQVTLEGRGKQQLVMTINKRMGHYNNIDEAITYAIHIVTSSMDSPKPEDGLKESGLTVIDASNTHQARAELEALVNSEFETYRDEILDLLENAKLRGLPPISVSWEYAVTHHPFMVQHVNFTQQIIGGLNYVLIVAGNPNYYNSIHLMLGALHSLVNQGKGSGSMQEC